MKAFRRVGILVSMVIPCVLLTLPATGQTCTTPTGAGACLPEPMGEMYPSMGVFDQKMQEVMCNNGIEAGALAIARNGKVIYRRSFGWKDEAHLRKLEPNALMRTASVTKPVSAAALTRIIDSGQPRGLSLGSRAFNIAGCSPAGVLNISPWFPTSGQQQPDFCDQDSTGSLDQNVCPTTIGDLVRQWSIFGQFDSDGDGGDDDNDGNVDEDCDPMFQGNTIAGLMGVSAPANGPQIGQWLLGKEYAPNAVHPFEYRNINYLMVGLLINQLRPQGYFEYLRNPIFSELLEPATEIQAAHDLANDSHPREPWYECSSGCYGGLNFVAGFSGGGLVASAHALALFAGKYRLPDAINNFDLVGIPNAPNQYFNGAMAGSMPGTSAIIRSFSNGVSYAAMFNERETGTTCPPFAQLQVLLDQEIQLFGSWPVGPVVDYNENGIDDLHDIYLSQAFGGPDLDLNDNGYLDASVNCPSCEHECVMTGCDDGIDCMVDSCYPLIGCESVDGCGDQVCNTESGLCVEPFGVISPNGGEVATSDEMTVTWHQGNTDEEGLVDIYLSLDGGETWDLNLAGTQNDGSAQVNLGIECPSSLQARIKIDAPYQHQTDESDEDFTVLCECPDVNGCGSGCSPMGANCHDTDLNNPACWDGADAHYCTPGSTISRRICDCVAPPPGGGLNPACGGGQSQGWHCPQIPDCPEILSCGEGCEPHGCAPVDLGYSNCVKPDNVVFTCQNSTIRVVTCPCLSENNCPAGQRQTYYCQ